MSALIRLHVRIYSSRLFRACGVVIFCKNGPKFVSFSVWVDSAVIHNVAGLMNLLLSFVCLLLLLVQAGDTDFIRFMVLY